MFSISLQSCEVKTFGEEAKQFVEDVNALLESLTSDSGVSLEDAERQVLEATRAWGPKLLEMCVSQNAWAPVSEPVACAVCQNACRRLRKRSRHFTTACGGIRVSRWVYPCESGHYLMPWEAGLSPKYRNVSKQVRNMGY